MSREEFEAAKRAALEGPLKRKKSLDAVCSAGKDLTKFPFLYALAQPGSPLAAPNSVEGLSFGTHSPIISPAS